MAHRGELPGVTKAPGNTRSGRMRPDTPRRQPVCAVSRNTTPQVITAMKPRRKGPAMTMTDPIADMLSRLRNGSTAYHDTVAMPHSNLKEGIAASLSRRATWRTSRLKDASVGKTCGWN